MTKSHVCNQQVGQMSITGSRSWLVSFRSINQNKNQRK